MNNKQLIEEVLKIDDRLWNKDKTELNQTLLLDLVEKIDEKVIGLLLQEENLREKFFVKIKDVYVFKTNDFRFFMEENKIDNSYTAYKNRIGLTDGKRFLKDTNDVVLNWPYKDCILEGGQSTEEGLDTYFEYSEKTAEYEEKKAKRKEIFYNQVLAYDEIDRLFDPKALVNWKRYTKDGEEEVKEIKRDEDGTIKENMIIKGNNLLALHSLKKQFAGKVKLIYIDPPYNTGNDGFKYNDNFNHSTWLTFIKNRLETAKELLRDDGVIFVQCDDNEQAYLKVLMDEVFGRGKLIGQIVWKKRSGVNDSKTNFSPNHDYILVFSKNENVSLVGEQKHFSNYTNPDNDPRGEWTAGDLTCNKTAEERPNLFYPITDPKTGITYQCNPNRVWRTVETKMKELIKQEKILFPKNTNGTPSYKRHLSEVKSDKQPVSSLFLNDALNQTATKEIQKIFNTKIFSTPKPESLIKKVIEISTQPNDIVLDYHLGSGTTAASAHKMGRQYIGIEQMDYVETIAVERLKKVIDGEQGGISKSVNWQGGGDFIYFELAKWNESAKEKILDCKNLEELEGFFDEMYDRYFLNYNLKIKEFREKVIKEEKFKNLSLDQQKKMFITMLDNNQMYVNKTEMADKKFGISEKDQKLTSIFYNQGR